MQESNGFSWKLFDESPVVGIVRGLPKNVIYKIVDNYIDAGLNTIEITMNTPSAVEIIKNLRKKKSSLNVGAGTVCSMEDLKRSLDAGAQFIVTPIINEEVIDKCVDLKVPIFPGAFTPTEIYKAWSLGASAVKLFPATQLGVQYIKDILGPLNVVKLLPTGGVSKSNIKEFMNVGAKGVGMGGSLFPNDLILNKDYHALKEHFVEVKREVSNCLKTN